MPINEDRISTLQDFGLTEYQARVYLALLDLGTAAASQIPSISRVPRTRIYTTMNQLHEKGLATIIPETPIKYEAVPFKQFLVKRVEIMRKETKRLESDMKVLAKTFEIKNDVKPNPAGRFETIHGRRNIKEKLSKMLESAKREVLAVGTNNFPVRMMKGNVYCIEDCHERGVKMVTGFRLTAENKLRAERLSNYGQIRLVHNKLKADTIIVDRKEAILIHPVPDDVDPILGEDSAIWTNDEAIVSDLKMFVTQVLQSGLNPALFQKDGNIIEEIGSWKSHMNEDAETGIRDIAAQIGRSIADDVEDMDDGKAVERIKMFIEVNELGTVSVASEAPLKISIKLADGLEGIAEKHVCLFLAILGKTVMAARAGTAVVENCMCGIFGTGHEGEKETPVA